MDENTLALTSQSPLSLDETTKSNLKTWEDYLSYYIQLNEAQTTLSWVKADLLLTLSEKFGDNSIEKFSKEISVPRSTVVNYIRTARAFPPEKRNPSLPFTTHFQASMADSYDEKEEGFITETRFDWIDRAADERLSTRNLAEEIKHEKKKMDLDVIVIPCGLCGRADGNIERYVFFSPGSRREADRYDLHELCYVMIKRFIKDCTECTVQNEGILELT